METKSFPWIVWRLQKILVVFHQLFWWYRRVLFSILLEFWLRAREKGKNLKMILFDMIFRLHQNDMLRRSSTEEEMINCGKFSHLQLPPWHWPNVIWYFSFPSPSSNVEISKRFKYSNKINYVLRGWGPSE